MGRRSFQERSTERKIGKALLSERERTSLRETACYEGSPFHKRNPGDFGLTPPSAPRPDKTLCDEAGVFNRALAEALFKKAVAAGLASEASTPDGFPKQFWVVDEEGRVFELIYGGSRQGCYHGYPVRKTDPLSDEVREAWRDRRCGR